MGRIKVSNLGKAYKQYPGRWSRLVEWLTPGNAVRHQLKWALKDITFDIQPGESVGIIGINGAGKSTLLKLITGTAQPTTGHVSISGQVAALLELGMGFHPDFTGRQNAIMAGQLLGMTAQEVTNLMPHIEAFAEIGEYIDSPVRVYSSGMQMRLAFSVATVKRPDVLIVDEALSVGDAYFQHKSFERIREFRSQGTTLLIVSHDKAAIQSVCDRAILLDAGRLAKEGAPEDVMDFYNARIAEREDSTVRQLRLADGNVQTVSGTGEASIESVDLLDCDGNSLSLVAVGQAIQIRITVSAHQDLDSLVLGCGVKDRLGQMVFGTNTFNTGQQLSCIKAGESYVFNISCLANLGVGSYSIHASLVRTQSHIEKNYHWIDGAIVFEVFNKDKPDFVGCSWNEMSFDIKKAAD